MGSKKSKLAMSGKKIRTVAVVNEKGGVGKTATVVNLAACLGKLDKNILVVDMDPQHNTTRGLGISLEKVEKSVYDLISTPDKLSVESTIISTDWQGVDLIPAHPDLAGAEVELVNQIGRENQLKKGLSPIVSKYDFILLDTPPSISLLTVNVLSFAKEVLIPCQTHPLALMALERLFETVDLVKDNINSQLMVRGVVPTLYDRRTKVNQETLTRLKSGEKTASLVFNTIIRINTLIAESAQRGIPIIYLSRNSHGAEDYISLTKEVIRRDN